MRFYWIRGFAAFALLAVAGCGQEPRPAAQTTGTPAERAIRATVARYNAAAGRVLGGDDACREMLAYTRKSITAQVAAVQPVQSCGEAMTALQVAGDYKAPHRLKVSQLRVRGRTATAIDSAAPSPGSRRLRFVKRGGRWKIGRLGVD